MNENDETTAMLLAALTAQVAALTAQVAEGAAAAAGARGAGERITVADLASKALPRLTAGTRRTYGSYIRLLAWGDPTVTGTDGRPFTGLGCRWADEVLPSDLEEVLALVSKRQKAGAAVRAANREAADRVVRDSRAKGAESNAVGAWRCLFEVAIKDRHLADGMNPASRVKKPKRSDRRRMALEDAHYEEMVELIGSTGDDPELDAMVVKYIDIAGARREGLLNLQLGGIDLEECTVRLDEKGEVVVDQPVPDWFAQELYRFACSRGAVSRTDPVFVKRTASGCYVPMGNRRFDYIFADRLQSSLAWADKLQVTAHTLRHHAITRIERTAGHAVAQAYARHAPQGVTDLYALASQAEVAEAVVAAHGGNHPWLERQPRTRR